MTEGEYKDKMGMERFSNREGKEGDGMGWGRTE